MIRAYWRGERGGCARKRLGERLPLFVKVSTHPRGCKVREFRLSDLSDQKSQDRVEMTIDAVAPRGFSKLTAAVAASGFDREFYLRCNPDVARAGVDPMEHYVEVGSAEGRWPREDFD